MLGSALFAQRAESPPDSFYGGPCTGSTYYSDAVEDKTCRVWIAFHDHQFSKTDCRPRLGSIAFRARVAKGSGKVFVERVANALGASGHDEGNYRWNSKDSRTLFNLTTAVEDWDISSDVVFVKLVHTPQ
jgi:hypothetical protein